MHVSLVHIVFWIRGHNTVLDIYGTNSIPNLRETDTFDTSPGRRKTRTRRRWREQVIWNQKLSKLLIEIRSWWRRAPRSSPCLLFALLYACRSTNQRECIISTKTDGKQETTDQSRPNLFHDRSSFLTLMGLSVAQWLRRTSSPNLYVPTTRPLRLSFGFYK